MTDADESPKAPRTRRVAVPRIPGYQIQSIIGRGSTGTVYRARQENVDREVALKVMHKELASRPRMVQRMQREARTTARLAHPHIVSAIDMGRAGEQWWFAMELVDGPSLALKLRQEGRLPEREALRLFIPLCEALVHIWENGVVHRDIKPANILIDKVSGARLADLGLAFADNDPHLTGSEGTLGTPHYISPEQARDPSNVDIRTDIWSFGATLFHAVCGEPPMRGANVAEVLSGVLYGRVPDPLDLEPDLSRGLSLVLRKCLSRDFEKRYQSPRELLRDLERVRERRKPRVRAATLEPTAGAGNQLVRSLFAAGLILVVGAGALLLWQRPWEEEDTYVPYGPLAELTEKLERRTAPPGVVLAQLEELRSELPPRDIVEWREAYNQARAERDAVLASVLGDVEANFEAALVEQRFARAERVLTTDLGDWLVKRAGLTREQAPTEFRLAVAGLEQRLGRAVTTAEGRLRDDFVARFVGSFQQEVDALVDAGRWRAASALLDISPMALTERLTIDLSSLPTTRQSDILELADGRLDLARKDLVRRWGQLDDELVRWVEMESRELAEELGAKLEPINAAARLRDGFEQELERRGIPRDELLGEPEGLARLRLAEEVAALIEREGRVVGQRDGAELDAFESLATWLDQSAGGQAYAARRYEDVLAYWRGREVWLAKSPVQIAPWWAELEEHVAGRIAETELLLRLRAGAVARLAELDGAARFQLRVTPEVRAEGVLDVQGSGPTASLQVDLGGGQVKEFYLVAPAGGLPQEAKLLETEDVLELGLGAFEPEEGQAVRAFFLLREGDTLAAEVALRAVDRSARFGPLAAEHLRGLERLASVEKAVAAKRADEVRKMFRALYFDDPNQRERLERDPTIALQTIGRLLAEFGDVPLVVARASELRNLERQLRAPRAGVELTLGDLESVFGSGNVTLTPDVVRLALDFQDLDVVGVDRGDWKPDGVGWLSPGDIASDEDMFARDEPRWILRPPFDADQRPVTVEFEFGEPSTSRAERVIVASALGFDVAIRTDSNAEVSRLVAGVGGADRALADLRAGEGTRFGRTLLEAGQVHVLRMVVDKRRGKLKVELDGVLLVERTLTSTMGRPGSYGVALVAWEQVRLLGLRAEVGR